MKDAGTGNIQYLSYGYDADNNVTSVTDNVTPGWTQGASYTNADQLSFASGPYGVVSTIKYNSGGNWTKYDTTTFTPQTASNRINKIGSATMAYDSAGHMTTGPSTSTMTYNKAGQQATATVFGSTTTNVYDGFGWRVTAQTGTGPTITQTYDQAGHYLERSAHDVSTDYVWLDGIPVAAINPSSAAVSALHTNILGAPVKATSAAQASVWTSYYAPCGVAGISGATITQDLRYPGMVSVSGSNFLNNGYRDNLTQDCAYMEPDLAGFLGGTNRYTYAANNPLTNTDRLGLADDPDPKAENETPEELQEEYFGPLLKNGPNLETENAPLPTESGSSVASPDVQEFVRDLMEENSPTNPPGMQCTVRPTQAFNAARTAPLLRAASVPDRGGYTVAGRSLTKHGVGARLGNSLFPPAEGNPATINQTAQSIVEDIISNPNSTVQNSYRGRLGATIEITAPNGQGVVYDASGNFLFFKE